MKRIISLTTVTLFLLPVTFSGADSFEILRSRVVPNNFEENLEGEAAFELTFRVIPGRWVPYLGWLVETFTAEGSLIESTSDAYFPGGLNQLNRIKEGRFKGGTTYIAYFPLPEEFDYVVAVLGRPGEIQTRLMPANRPLEDFEIPLEEVYEKILQSDLIKLPVPEEGELLPAE